MIRYSFTRNDLEKAIKCIYYGVCCKCMSKELSNVAHSLIKTSYFKGIGIESLIDIYFC